MLAMLFHALICAAFILATGSIIGTWARYASAWQALDARMAPGMAQTRHVTVRVIDRQRMAAVIYSPRFRPEAPAFARPYARRAAA